MTRISILIPTTASRKHFLDDLLGKLHDQIGGQPATSIKYGIKYIQYSDIEILIDTAETDKIGTKRNRLLQACTGEYCCFFDDDDTPSPEYISTLRAGVLSQSDCISLMGIMTVDGNNPEVFEHSIRYSAYKTNEGAVYPDVKYERFPNHISCIKSSIAKQILFPEINYSEDTKWATKLFESNLIKTEYSHENVLYYYKYRTKK